MSIDEKTMRRTLSKTDHLPPSIYGAVKKNKLVIGIDEVGTGALAGPVWIVAAGFVYNKTPDERITDSKKLSDGVRRVLTGIILHNLDYLDIETISAEAISTDGLAHQMDLAMHRIATRASEVAKTVIVDGTRKFVNLKNVHSFPKADFTYWQVSSASILAKVWRDTEMDRLSSCYDEQYDWLSNKGYGTKKHKAAIAALGVTDLHRTSFKLL